MKVTAAAHLTKSVLQFLIFGFPEPMAFPSCSGRFHLRDFDDLSLGVVHSPTCLPSSKYPDRILVPSFLNHSQYPVSTSSMTRPLALMLPSLWRSMRCFTQLSHHFMARAGGL